MHSFHYFRLFFPNIFTKREFNYIIISCLAYYSLTSKKYLNSYKNKKTAFDLNNLQKNSLYLFLAGGVKKDGFWHLPALATQDTRDADFSASKMCENFPSASSVSMRKQLGCQGIYTWGEKSSRLRYHIIICTPLPLEAKIAHVMHIFMAGRTHE